MSEPLNTKIVSILASAVNRGTASELTQFLKSKSACFMYHEGKKSANLITPLNLDILFPFTAQVMIK